MDQRDDGITTLTTMGLTSKAECHRAGGSWSWIGNQFKQVTSNHNRNQVQTQIKSPLTTWKHSAIWVASSMNIIIQLWYALSAGPNPNKTLAYTAAMRSKPDNQDRQRLGYR